MHLCLISLLRNAWSELINDLMYGFRPPQMQVYTIPTQMHVISIELYFLEKLFSDYSTGPFKQNNLYMYIK